MRWILENFGFFVFVFVAISMARAMRKAMQQKQEHEASTDETDEQRNLRRVREEIRRKIAERRGGVPVEPPPPLLARGEEPVPRRPKPPNLPFPLPLPDLLEGPMKRMLAEIEGRVEPRRAAPPPLPVPDGAALARREQLAEQMRVLEESRLLARRRAAEIAATQRAVNDSEAGALAASRGTLLAELRDPRSLRRAFVLREVLGPPVALR